MQAKMYTSLNHGVYIHRHDAFRADEMCYIEARSPWAADGRALVQTRIFARDGGLVASCVQEVRRPWFDVLFPTLLVDLDADRYDC